MLHVRTPTFLMPGRNTGPGIRVISTDLIRVGTRMYHLVPRIGSAVTGFGPEHESVVA